MNLTTSYFRLSLRKIACCFCCFLAVCAFTLPLAARMLVLGLNKGRNGTQQKAWKTNLGIDKAPVKYRLTEKVCLSRMWWKSQIRFLGEGRSVMVALYPTQDLFYASIFVLWKRYEYGCVMDWSEDSCPKARGWLTVVLILLLSLKIGAIHCQEKSSDTGRQRNFSKMKWI